MITTINCIPNELLVLTLGFFSNSELIDFSPPDRRFRDIWRSELENRNRPGDFFHFGVTILKMVKTNPLPSNQYGGILAQCLDMCPVPNVILSPNDENEGRPILKRHHFVHCFTIQGRTATSDLPFFSIKLCDDKILTVYQQWKGRHQYWVTNEGSKVSFLTDRDLVRLARLILGGDKETSTDRALSQLSDGHSD